MQYCLSSLECKGGGECLLFRTEVHGEVGAKSDCGNMRTVEMWGLWLTNHPMAFYAHDSETSQWASNFSLPRSLLETWDLKPHSWLAASIRTCILARSPGDSCAHWTWRSTALIAFIKKKSLTYALQGLILFWPVGSSQLQSFGFWFCDVLRTFEFKLINQRYHYPSQPVSPTHFLSMPSRFIQVAPLRTDHDRASYKTGKRVADLQHPPINWHWWHSLANSDCVSLIVLLQTSWFVSMSNSGELAQ